MSDYDKPNTRPKRTGTAAVSIGPAQGLDSSLLGMRTEIVEKLSRQQRSELTAAGGAGLTGAMKADQDKPRTDLIPPRALLEEAKVWGFGAKKYAPNNWRKGLTILRVCGAIMRHTVAIMMGEDIDSDTQCHHAACIRCEAGMLIEFFYEGRPELDDRYKGAIDEKGTV